MRILSFWLLATVLACGGGGVWSSSDSDRFEYTDPAETTPMEDAFGTPAIDVDRVVMKSDGNALVVVLHLQGHVGELSEGRERGKWDHVRPSVDLLRHRR